MSTPPKTFPMFPTFPIALGIIGVVIIGYGVQIFLAKSDLEILIAFIIMGLILIFIAIVVYLWDKKQYHKHIEELGILHGYPKT